MTAPNSAPPGCLRGTHLTSTARTGLDRRGEHIIPPTAPDRLPVRHTGGVRPLRRQRAQESEI
jgi:hypothetical protein